MPARLAGTVGASSTLAEMPKPQARQWRQRCLPLLSVAHTKREEPSAAPEAEAGPHVNVLRQPHDDGFGLVPVERRRDRGILGE